MITPHRILIIRLSAIGDVARTLPALRAIRSAHPAAYIAWVVEDSSADLLRGHPDLNRVFVLRRSQWRQDIRHLKTWVTPFSQLAMLVREIRQERFDLTLDFHGILKSGLISYCSGSAVRAGFSRRYCKEANHLFNNLHVDVGSTSISRIERNLRFASFLGISAADAQNPVIPVTESDKATIDRFLSDHALEGRWPLVAIHPGTSRKTIYKRWELSYYAALADRLTAEQGAHIIWTWGPGELTTVQEVVALMKKGSTVSAGHTLTQLAELFRRCALFIGSDSGPMHIASFMKTPVVVIYGPTDHVVNAPFYEHRARILRKDVSCNPCRDRSCSRRACMAAVTPDEVFNAATGFLAGVHQVTAGPGEEQVIP